MSPVPTGFCLSMYQSSQNSSERFRIVDLGLGQEDVGGKRCRSWLRRCSTSQKVAGSIPGGFIDISNWNECQKYFVWR